MAQGVNRRSESEFIMERAQLIYSRWFIIHNVNFLFCVQINFQWEKANKSLIAFTQKWIKTLRTVDARIVVEQSI